ncbi:MAG: proteasome accessory factor PafA2 family protein, partial [Armatimonadetes bacterium]|nr:proteasome accessory factor PafA2 family protein [Armatimonadota bacterium]
ESPAIGWGVEEQDLRRVLRREGVPAERYEAFCRLRAELCELDTRYAQIGPHGLFAQLEADGLLDHRVPGCEPERELDARTTPPQTTRAKVRGELVRRCAGQAYRYRCDWSVVQDVVGHRVLDLSDPFCLEEHWTESRAAW